MKHNNPFPALAFILAVALSATNVQAGHVSVAVASNFDFTFEELKREFERTSGHSVTMVPGPSASHYARIVSEDVPFDIFLSDDDTRAAILEQEGLAIPGTRFTYARARLVLWGLDYRPLSDQILRDRDFRLLAVSNERLSPFGRAAREVLEALGVWEQVQDRLVTGENIGQTYHFAISGDVDMALIAYSQIIYGNFMQAGSFWMVPETLYSPIDQQGVLLTDNEAARDFLAFMQGAQGRDIILSNGFHVP